MIRTLIVLSCTVVAISCGASPNARIEPLRIIVTGEVELPPGAIDDFAERRGIPVQLSREEDSARALEAVAVSPDRPVADIVIGVPDAVLDDFDGSVAVRAVPASLMPDIGVSGARTGLAPLSLLDMCLIWDREGLRAADLSPPPGPGTLLDPVWAGRFVIPDPATTLEGRLFLESLRSLYGDDPRSGWISAVGSLLGNDLIVAPSWRSSFDQFFTSTATPDGPPVTWGGSALPGVVLRLIDPLPSQSPLGVSTGSGCVRSVIGAVIPMNAARPGLAEDLIAELQSPAVQNRLFDDRGGLPVQPTELPEAYTRFAIRPASPLPVTPPLPDRPGVTALWNAITEAPG